MRRKRISYFRYTTLAVLFAFGASIAALFAADISYIHGTSLTEALASSSVRHAFLLSLVTSLAATALSILVAVPAGYALSRYPFRGRIVVDVMVDALIVLPVLVIGISLLVLFRQGADLEGPGRSLLLAASSCLAETEGQLSQLKCLFIALPGTLLVGAGKLFAWLGNLFVYRVPGIILAQFFCAASYAVRVMNATFDELDPRTEQVAMTLGCTRAGAFRRVTLPMARHGLVAAAVLSWARAVGVFGPVMIVAGAVENRTQVLPTSIFLEISVGDLELALAISVLMIIMAFVVLLALKTFSKSTLFGRGAGE